MTIIIEFIPEQIDFFGNKLTKQEKPPYIVMSLITYDVARPWHI